MAYEKEQHELKRLMQEMLSDESDFSPDHSEYEPSSEDSDEPITPKKKKNWISKTDSQKVKKILQIPECQNYQSFIGLNKTKDSTRDPFLSEIFTHNMQASTSAEAQPLLLDKLETPTLLKKAAVGDFSSIDGIIETVILQNAYDNSSEDENIASETITWGPISGNYLKNFNFTEDRPGIYASLYDHYEKTPYDVFKMIVTDEIFQLFVDETNKYAAQEKNKSIFRRSRIKDWKDTNQQEMEKFIGCIMWMGLLSLPSISSYWSNNLLYENNLRKVMARNRFQMLLKTWHFADNASENARNGNDRLYKITPLLNKLRESFQSKIIPGEYICIDETLVPFKGKLKFKQYISNKRHKFGIKLFKLCLEGGYLYDLKVYCGQEKDIEKTETVPTKVVLNLTADLLGKGRTLCVDNYYISVELAHKLMEDKTFLLGTLRTNRKNNPKNVLQKKLKKGEVCAEESSTGVFVEKWKDKRDILMLNTKFVPEMVTIHKRTGEIEKPKSVLEYNKHKSYIDISDQMKSYNTSLRRGVKWYRKLAIELVVGSALVNAFIIHQSITNDKMTITKFREHLIKSLVKQPLSDFDQLSSDEHVLEDSGKKQICSGCYRENVTQFGRKAAKNKTAKTKYRCNKCLKCLCLDCFFVLHNADLKP